MAADLHLDPAKLAEFCQRRRIRKLALFGSALRGDFGPDSDIDFLVEFEPDAAVTYLDLAEMEDELARLLGTTRRVDLRTPRERSHYFREHVIESAEVQYDAA